MLSKGEKRFEFLQCCNRCFWGLYEKGGKKAHVFQPASKFIFPLYCDCSVSRWGCLSYFIP